MNIMYLIFSFNMGGIERLLIDMSREVTQRGHRAFVCVINEDYTPSLLDSLDPAVQVVLLHRNPGKTGVRNSMPDASGDCSGDNNDSASGRQSAASPRTAAGAGAAAPTGENNISASRASAPQTVNSRKAMLRLAAFIHENRIDILHCQGINCVLFAAPAKLRFPRLKILNTVHDTGNYTSYSAVKVLAGNLLLDHTIAISEAVRSEILSRGMSPKKVTTIHNAVDTEKFCLLREGTKETMAAAGSGPSPALQPSKPSDTASATGESPLSGAPAPLRIGCVARFFPAKKGQDLLVTAVEKLLAEDPDLNMHCVLAGDIYKGQQEAYDALTAHVAEAGLGNVITFTGGLAPDDVPAFLHTLDLFVLPSRYEGFGISLIEAMACGLPCVASNLEGPAEIITDESLGALFTPGDADALAVSLRLAIDRLRAGYYDPQHISLHARDNYSLGAMTTRHLELYAVLLK